MIVIPIFFTLQRHHSSRRNMPRSMGTRWTRPLCRAMEVSRWCRTPIWVLCRALALPPSKTPRACQDPSAPELVAELQEWRRNQRRPWWTRSRASRRCPARRFCCPTMTPSTVHYCPAWTRCLPSSNWIRRTKLAARNSSAWCTPTPRSMLRTATWSQLNSAGEFGFRPKVCRN